MKIETFDEVPQIVRKNVRPRKTRWPFDELEVGQAVVISLESSDPESNKKGRIQLVAAANSWNKRNKGEKLLKCRQLSVDDEGKGRHAAIRVV